MKSNKALVVVLFLSTLCTLIYSQQSPTLLNQQLATYQAAYPQEKVYIHHDKAYYVSGETLWLKAYLLDASQHHFLTPSQIVHVELVDSSGSVVSALALNIEKGGAAGDIYINPEWEVGSYTLRAYTQYMRNYGDAEIFQKEIPIYASIEKAKFSFAKATASSVSTDFSVQFFPEGGDLVLGLLSKVSFKATDENGKGIAVKGQVVDENNNPITQLVSFPLGYGSFRLKPAANKTYKVQADYNGQLKTFDLPPILSEGYVLQVNNQKKESTIVKIKTNIPNGLEDAFLMGHIRGQVFFTLEDLQEGAIYRLPKAGLPSGVAHITLFNGKGLPVAERLLYIDTDSITTKELLSVSKNNFSKREKVQLQIALPPTDTFKIANLSLSVTDHFIAPVLNTAQDIQSYLLLESDLKGVINKPAYFFDDKNPRRTRLLDLLLLTQGWRRFTWQDILSDQKMSLNYPVENSFTISGIVTKKGRRNKPVKADVSFSSMGKDMLYNQITTNENGRFTFANLSFADTTNILLQANLYKGKKKKEKKEFGASGNRNVSIYLEELDKPDLTPPFICPFSYDEFRIQELDPYDIDFDRLQNLADENIWEIDFDEVVVRGRRKEFKDERHLGRTLYREPDNRVHLDSFPNMPYNNIFDFLRGKVPGIRVIGSGFEKTVRIRGTNSITLNTNATILLDGMAVTSGIANSIDPRNIAFVDVLKSYSKTSIYGAAGSGGIIALYTRGPEDIKGRSITQSGILNIQHPGYYQAREFYSPIYSSNKNAAKDYRVTLFWEPTIYLSENKQHTTVTFYTADRATQYHVRLEGVTDTGTILKTDAFFKVE